VFSQGERRDLRECLVAAARADERIGAAAVVGSAATDREDEWSDIEAMLVRGLRRSELSTAFATAITALIDEAEQIDPGLASRLRQPARELVRTAKRVSPANHAEAR